MGEKAALSTIEPHARALKIPCTLSIRLAVSASFSGRGEIPYRRYMETSMSPRAAPNGVSADLVKSQSRRL